MKTKLEVGDYMKYVRIMINFLAINIIHLISNESSQKEKIEEIKNIESLKTAMIPIYFISIIFSTLSLSNNLKKNEELIISLFFHIFGIFLNISTKPKGWYVSLYDKTDPAINKQGRIWCVSMAMFLGELMTFAHIPYWIKYLESNVINLSFFALSSLGFSFVLRDIYRNNNSSPLRIVNPRKLLSNLRKKIKKKK